MPIAELGYRAWQGRRLGPWRRWLAITRMHVGVALRSSKLLRRFLFVAWSPLLYFGPVFFAVGWVANPANDLSQGGLMTAIAREVLLGPSILDQLRATPGTFLPAMWAVAFYFFFSLTQTFCMLVVIAIVAPPLIARDVQSKAFLLYLAKPISALEYLAGKLGVILFFVFAITLFPALVLYAISISLCPDLGIALATTPILLRIVGASLAMGIPVAMVALLLSSSTRNHRIAMFGWIAVCLFGEIAYRSIAFGGAAGGTHAPVWAPFLSLREVAIMASSTVFDVGGQLTAVVTKLREGGADIDALLGPLARDFEPGSPVRNALLHTTGDGAVSGALPAWASLAFLAALTVVSGAIVLRRITKPVRI